MDNILNFSNLLDSLLNIIGYKEDKQEFTLEFLNNIFKQTIGDQLLLLPQRKKEEYLNQINHITDPNMLIEFTNRFF